MLRASAQSLHITPVYGTNSDRLQRDPTAPLATIVEVDHVTILVDCGGSADFNPAFAQMLLPYVETLDAVLISSVDLSSCGSIPYLHKILPSDVPIFSTLPTTRGGLMNVVEQFTTRFLTAMLPSKRPVVDWLSAAEGGATAQWTPEALSVDDIHAAFKRIQEVQFAQAVRVTKIRDKFGNLISGGSGAHHHHPSSLTAAATTEYDDIKPEVTVRAVRAGGLVGAAVWRISHQTDDILIAPKFSLTSGHAIRPFDPPKGSSVVLMDASPCTIPAANTAADTQLLLKLLREAFRRDGGVLIPINCFGRGFELVVMLANLWEREGLSYPLILACPKGKAFVERLRTMGEFVLPGVFHEDDEAVLNDRVQFAQTVQEVESIGQGGGKCVIAHTSGALDDGLAAQLLPSFLSDRYSCVVLTSKPPVGTPAHTLYFQALWSSGSGTPAPIPPNLPFEFQRYRKEFLEGDDLTAYMEEVKEDRAMMESDADQALAEGHVVRANVADDWSESDDDEDNVHNNGAEDNGDAKNQQQQQHRPSSTVSLKVVDEPKQPLGTSSSSSPNQKHHRQCTPGLFLPSNVPPFTSDYLMFPPYETKHVFPPCITGTVYGDPLDEGMLRMLKQYISEHTYAEVALSDAVLHRTAQQEDNAPAKVLQEKCKIPRVEATCHFYDFTGNVNGDSLRALLKNHFAGCRKLVFLHGTAQDTRLMMQFAQGEGITRESRHQKDSVVGNAGTAAAAAAVQTVFGPHEGETISVASAVNALDVNVDPGLVTEVLNPSMRGVVSASGGWDIGWVRAMLVPAVEGHAHSKKRERETTTNNINVSVGGDAVATAEGGHPASTSAPTAAKQPPPTLMPPSCGAIEHPALAASGEAAVQQQRQHMPGSIFIGDLHLPLLGRNLRENSAISSIESHPTAPVLIANKVVAVRQSRHKNEITIEGVPCPEQFLVRKAVYSQFGQVI